LDLCFCLKLFILPFKSKIRLEAETPIDRVEFLADKPLFAAIADEFLAFVGDGPLVAHKRALTLPFSNPS
jgi:hypothetical protein